MTSNLWPFAGQEVKKDSTFGGLVFDSKGIVEPTARWRENKGFAITPYMQSRPNFGVLTANEQAFSQAAISVGRIKFGNDLLSGWLAAANGVFYFISSAHNFNPQNLVGTVCFDDAWEGDKYVNNDATFDVTYEAALQNAHLVIWKFGAQDHARLPAPLRPGAPLAINDQVVVTGYSAFPEESVVQAHFNNLPLHIRQTVPVVPDLKIALQVFHPHQKSGAPGTITAVTHTVNAQPFGYAVTASLYHGMSGGAVFSIHGGNVGVSGQVVGALGTENVNANTVLNLHHPDVSAFIGKYMA